MQNYYNISPSPDGLSYKFTTRFNIAYLLVLTTVEIGGIGAFSLSLYPEQEAPQPDYWIKNTVIIIIADLLEKDSNVVFYVCDSADGKEDKRDKIFDYWYEMSVDDYPYIGKFDHSITSGNGYKVNSSILYNKNNYLVGHIIASFKDLMNIM